MSKEWNVIITDNATEQIKLIWDGTRFAIITRNKGNGHKPDSTELFNPIEMAKIIRPARDELVRLWHEEKNETVKSKIGEGI